MIRVLEHEQSLIFLRESKACDPRERRRVFLAGGNDFPDMVIVSYRLAHSQNIVKEKKLQIFFFMDWYLYFRRYSL